MKRNILFILFILAFCNVKSQTFSYEWVSKTTGGTGTGGIAVALDDSGNVVSAGRFNGSVDFDPGPGVYNMTSIATKNLSDIYVLKQDKAGNFIWARQFGGSWWEYVKSLCMDDSGNIYLNGTFSDTVDFDPGAGVFNLIAGFRDQGFVCKLNASGNFVWAKTVAVTFNSMALDSLSNVYLSGDFGGTVDFDPGSATYNLQTAGNKDVFAVKLNSEGNFLWAKRIGGKGYEGCYKITVDLYGNMVLAGTFNDTADFDPSSGIYNLVPKSRYPMFVCKLNTQGDFMWATNIDGNGSPGNINEVLGLTSDSRGNIYTTGVFEDTIDFDPGPNTAKFNTPLQDIFLLKLDKNGKYKFLKQLVTNDDWELAYSVKTDTRDNVYLVGSFKNSVDFAPFSGGYVVTPDSGTLFVSCMDSSGNLYWAKNYGTDFNSSTAKDIAVNNTNDLFITGHFSKTADFKPGPGKVLLTSASADAYVLKLKNCFPSSVVLTPKACFSYTSPSKKHQWTSSGLFKDTIINYQGCDSFFTINLTIDTVNVKVTNSSPTLTAVETGATYQWVDCNNGFAKINGVTNQSYLATVNGSFAVVVSKNGCSDTSACFAVNNAGLSANLPNLGASIYPNPTNGEVNIETGDFEGALRAQIHNSAGQTVKSYHFKKSGLLRITMPDIPGLYFIELISETNQKANFYVIKN